MMAYKVAVLGATGAVGNEMLKVLAERKFPISELIPLASERSAGKQIDFAGSKVTIRKAEESAFKGVDIVLGAAENDIAEEMAPFIKKAGAVFVDNSSAFRLFPEVPLVVPEVNAEDVKWHSGIIANPNCVTIIAAVAMNPILKLSPAKRIIASSYQAVSGAGIGGLRELEAQARAYGAGDESALAEHKAFAHQIAFNLIPKIGGMKDNGYSSEEMKLQNEGRKILHMPDVKVSCTCVRVPVFRSHSISISIETEEEVSLEAAAAALANAPGVKLVDDPANEIYPMPLDTSDQDTVFVGRLRRDLALDNGIALWCCGDQIRKGAATNAIQIAELLI
ncbi:MAG: aspartate-semialdehyde dehydrogenase [Firmicutes bacterium]|nr:aspartate-semialdehyde dehydrogenase [Bacillota bacterium]